MNTPSAVPVPTANALSVEQRVHLDLHGYVLVEGLVGRGEAEVMRERLLAIEARYRRDAALPSGVRSYFGLSESFFCIDNLPHVDPSFRAYCERPRIVAIAEEMVGGAVRLEQSGAHINRPGKDQNDDFAFHRGGFSGLGHYENDLYHHSFVKALTNLDDLGADDGGTAVIPGSHKVHQRLDPQIIAAAQRDRSLIRQVMAPIGSTLFFFESLLHSGGILRSGKTRPLIVAGYTPTMFQAWSGYDPEPAFLAGLDEEARAFYSGSRRWDWHPRYRSLM